MSPVKQPLHILRKDAMHIWPETLLSIALLLALAWAIPHAWAPDVDQQKVVLLNLGFYVLEALIIISWLVLASRLVHDEELVGDRQFWTTRPYTWYGLFTSKVLYILIFVGIPIILTQAWLIHHAHLYPTTVIPGLIKSFLQLAAIFLLPLMAIAAVTGTFIRYISSALGALVYVIAIIIIALSTSGFAYWMEVFGAPGLSYVLAAIYILFPLAALFIQYALRKTMIARIVLIATPLVLLIAALGTPRNVLSTHRYPDSAIGKATYLPVDRTASTDPLNVTKHEVTVFIPVTPSFDGLSDKSIIEAQRYQLTLDGEGVHYVSDWEVTEARFVPGEPGTAFPVLLPEDVFNKVHLKPVALHISLGTQLLNLGTPYMVTATEAPFPLPGHATCTDSNEKGVLSCHFPFGNTSLTAVSAIVHDGDCDNPGQRSGPAQGLIPEGILPFGFNPVDADTVQLGVGNQKVFVCPGTQLTFTRTEPGAYGRTHVDIPAITLDSYAIRIPPRPIRRAQQPQQPEQPEQPQQ